MFLSGFEAVIIYSVDFGTLLAKDSRATFRTLQAKREFLPRLLQGVKNATGSVGSFRFVGDEGGTVMEDVKRSIILGGKNIFSPSFFTQHAPLLFRDDRDESLNGVVKQATDQILTSVDLEMSLVGQSVPVCLYRGAELRLFRNGTLSMRLSFSNPQTTPQSCLSIDDFIELIRNLSTQAYLGFQKRVARISREWTNPQHPVAKSAGLRFKECDLAASNLNESQVRSYRTIMLLSFE